VIWLVLILTLIYQITPGAKGVYFQANLSSDAPDRTAYARLSDAASGNGIANSDFNYTGLTPTLKESGPLSLPAGKVTLRVQLHAVLNQAIIQNPRLKIVY
jgi:hypothetical protein